MQPVIIELLAYSSLIHGSLKLSRLQGFKYNIQQQRCSRVDTSDVSRKLSKGPYIYIIIYAATPLPY